MAIVSSCNRATSLEGGSFIFYVKESLKTVGWVVSGSGNTTTGALDGVDRLTTVTLAGINNSWIVLSSPHALAADKVQIILRRSATSSSYIEYRFNPNNNYSGGTASVAPTSSSDISVYSGTVGSNLPFFIHVTADNSAPYGWGAYTLENTDSASVGALCGIFPMINQPDGAGKPYVAAWKNFSSFTTGGGAGYGSNYTQKVSGGSPVSTHFCDYTDNSGNVVIPGSIRVDNYDGNNDLSFPIIMANHISQEYHGVVNFLQFNGVNRGFAVTYANRTRIGLGLVNLPWDGVTRPLV